MAEWVKLCDVREAPVPGEVVEAEAGGQSICLANLDGELCAVSNFCPHRNGPMGQGWIEGETVVCPWHSWSFHLKTGKSEFPPNESISAFEVRTEGSDVLINLQAK